MLEINLLMYTEAGHALKIMRACKTGKSGKLLTQLCREKILYLQEGGEETADIMANYPREPPPIEPPQFKKADVYENNMAVFEVIDETAKKAAAENYKTFSNLVRVLVGRCASELDKARAIFRYIFTTLHHHCN